MEFPEHPLEVVDDLGVVVHERARLARSAGPIEPDGSSEVEVDANGFARPIRVPVWGNEQRSARDGAGERVRVRLCADVCSERAQRREVVVPVFECGIKSVHFGP